VFCLSRLFDVSVSLVYKARKPLSRPVGGSEAAWKETMMGRLSRLIGAAAAVALLFGASLPLQHADAGTFGDIKARKKVTVATEAAYPPFEFMQEGKIVGFDADVLHRVVDGWGVELEHLDVPFSGILTGLLQKKYDFVCTGLIMNPDRTSKYAFTMPVAVAPVALIKRKGDAKVTSVSDLSGLRIGGPVPPSGPTNVLTSYSQGLKDKGAAEIVHFQSAPDEFLALANGQIDAAVETTLTVNELMRKHPDTYELIGTIGKPFYYGWATRPEDTDLRDAINAEIERLNKSGELAKLQEKWFGAKMDTPTSGYLPPGSI
jgi:polar amino acid transport system substrate-binding protein